MACFVNERDQGIAADEYGHLGAGGVRPSASYSFQ